MDHDNTILLLAEMNRLQQASDLKFQEDKKLARNIAANLFENEGSVHAHLMAFYDEAEKLREKLFELRDVLGPIELNSLLDLHNAEKKNVGRAVLQTLLLRKAVLEKAGVPLDEAPAGEPAHQVRND